MILIWISTLDWSAWNSASLILLIGANANCTNWDEENWPRASEKSHNSKYVIYSTLIMRSPVGHIETEYFLVSISIFATSRDSFQFHLHFMLNKTKVFEKSQSKKFWLHKGFDAIIIFSNFMCIGWNFWNFFFQLLLPGKTLHVSHGIFAKKFWTYFLLLTVFILEYFFA